LQILVHLFAWQFRISCIYTPTGVEMCLDNLQIAISIPKKC